MPRVPRMRGAKDVSYGEWQCSGVAWVAAVPPPPWRKIIETNGLSCHIKLARLFSHYTFHELRVQYFNLTLGAANPR